MKHRKNFVSSTLGLGILLATLAASVFTVVNVRQDIRKKAQVLSATATLVVQSSSDVANEDGSSFTSGGDSAWLGTGQNISASYLGIRFQGDAIPKDAQITSAKVEFSPKGTQWISVAAQIKGEATASPISFSSSSKPSSRNLTSASGSFSDNVKWEEGNWYSYDVTSVI